MASGGKPVVIDEVEVGEVNGLDGEGGSIIEEAEGLGAEAMEE